MFRDHLVMQPSTSFVVAEKKNREYLCTHTELPLQCSAARGRRSVAFPTILPWAGLLLPRSKADALQESKT